MKVELEFGALAMDTIITRTEVMVMMEATVVMEATKRFAFVRAVVGAPTPFPYTQHQQRRLSSKRTYYTYRPCCVFFTNKRRHDETHSRDPLITRNSDTNEGYGKIFLSCILILSKKNA